MSVPTQQYNMTLIIIGCVGALVFFIILLFWFCHLSQHKNHPIYRIREPIFWTMTMIIISIVPIWRVIAIYLFANQYIHRDIYGVLETFRLVVLTFGFVFVR